MKKKITLKELKIKRIATTLNANEKEQAKGGYYYSPGNISGVSGGKERWTEIKTSVETYLTNRPSL